jgi:uroporphyrinogen-III synthase
MERRAPAPGRLDGIGVIVTRPPRQSARFAERLASLGARAIVWPAIIILPPDDAAALQHVHATLERYDAAIFVSANAVEFGAPDPARWPARLAIFAPGLGTAEAIIAVGLPPPHVSETTFDSEGLLALPALADVTGKRVAIFRGEDGRALLGDTLRARGAQVDYVTCYRRARPADARGLNEAFAASRIDAVTITSSEGLDNLWSIVDAPTRARWSSLPTFVPHERIAAHARDLGLTTALTGPGDAGLVAGLLEWAARNFPQQG